MLVIDGILYNVPITSFKRTADALDKYAERTDNGDLARELIGIYFNYQITFGYTSNRTEYNNLWNKLTQATEFHTIIVPDGTDSTLTFQGYFSNVSDNLVKSINGKNYWGGLTLNITSKKPTRS